MEIKKRKFHQVTSLEDDDVARSPPATENAHISESKHWQCLSQLLAFAPSRKELYNFLSLDEKRKLLQLILKAIQRDPNSELAYQFLGSLIKNAALFTTILQDEKTGIQTTESKRVPANIISWGLSMLPLWKGFWMFLNEKYSPDLAYRLEKGSMTPADRFRYTVLNTEVKGKKHVDLVAKATMDLFSSMPDIARTFWKWINQHPEELQHLLDPPLLIVDLDELPNAGILPLLLQFFDEPLELHKLKNHYFHQNKINQVKHKLQLDSLNLREFCDYHWDGFPFPTQALKKEVENYVTHDCSNLNLFPCLENLTLAQLYTPPPHPSHPFPGTAPPGIGYHRAKEEFNRKINKRVG